MSLTPALEAILDGAARRRTVADDVLLGETLETVAGPSSSGSGRPCACTTSHWTRLARPDGRGTAIPVTRARSSPLVVHGTAVDLFVTVDGAATSRAPSATTRTSTPASPSTRRRAGVVRYAAEHPLANAANRHLNESLRYVESQVEIVNQQVTECNDAGAGHRKGFEGSCRLHAQERKHSHTGSNCRLLTALVGPLSEPPERSLTTEGRDRSLPAPPSARLWRAARPRARAPLCHVRRRRSTEHVSSRPRELHGSGTRISIEQADELPGSERRDEGVRPRRRSSR